MLSLRKAEATDLMLYFEWRNEPAVIANSLSHNAVTLRDHRRWFQRKVNDSMACLYVIEVDSVPAGQIRFELAGTQATVHYSLDAGFRGRGLATPSMRRALLALRLEKSDLSDVVAEVKPANIASSRVFERLGFARDRYDEELQANCYRLRLTDWQSTPEA